VADGVTRERLARWEENLAGVGRFPTRSCDAGRLLVSAAPASSTTHAGTPRMHVDPAPGVTDMDGRAQGSDNLYVTGAGLLPTAGFVNPTLTIVALARRLADHVLRR